ncbi:MAG: hypothetical protein JST54_15950 [Deltaproteobacteria bacterium]|nr:hypothetical protein [Deltaproteobacteria bacterium]
MARSLCISLLISCGCGAMLPDSSRVQRSALAGDAGALGTYNVAPGDVAVAGISSGGFMAVQLHVAYSATFQRGAAIFAGGPFYCAQDSIVNAITTCETGSPTASTYESTTDSYANSGDIDPTSNLSGAQVWMWSGTGDTTVKQSVMDSLQGYYQHYRANVTYDNTSSSGHAWISPDATNSCTVSQTPYINNCNVDAEQQFLSQFWGSLQPKSTGSLQGSFIPFDQDEFLDDGNAPAHSMDETGWLYVPPSCASGSVCHLVVALHGCEQNYGNANIGDTFIKKTGLDEWADTNGILVLYPQTTTSSSNSNACWDWWGYDDANYAKKSGHQMLAIKRMVDRITGVASTSTSTSTGTTTTTATATATSTSGSGSSTGSTTGGFCQIFTDNNYNHVQAGRAYIGSPCAGGHACAVGSNDDMGLYNTFQTTTLVEAPQGYYAIGTSCPTSSTSATGTSGTSTSATSTSATGTSVGASTGSATGASTTSDSSTSTSGATGGTSTSSSGTGSTTAGSTSAGATSGASASATGGSSGSTGGSSSGGCGSAGADVSILSLLTLVVLRRQRTRRV